MTDELLESRLEFLLSAQNSDGGWGYFPGKKSWLEPTAYAMLALRGRANSENALLRAKRLAQSWQLPDGSFRPASSVPSGTWVTALGALISEGQPDWRAGHLKALHWLTRAQGAESRLAVRLASHFQLLKTNLDITHPGWPWYPGNSSWIEPTALTIVALQKAGVSAARVQEGRRMILARRGRDGGWNCGNSNILNYDLPSYPESTGLALLGLQGLAGKYTAGPMDVARRFYARCHTQLGRAWLMLAFLCYGEPLPAAVSGPSTCDVMLAALLSLSHPAGNYRVFQVKGIA